jgi:putative Holliday junction resolvase
MPDPAAVRRAGLMGHSSDPRSADSAIQQQAGTVLAFDYGTERIGVAVGEAATGLAHPLTTIRAGTIDARFDAIRRLIDEWKPSLLVVGVPVHVDGQEHEMTARAERFARRLEGRFGLPVELVDERLSTRAAVGKLHEAGVDARRQKPVRDQVAAQTILETWMQRDDR